MSRMSISCCIVLAISVGFFTGYLQAQGTPPSRCTTIASSLNFVSGLTGTTTQNTTDSSSTFTGTFAVAFDCYSHVSPLNGCCICITSTTYRESFVGPIGYFYQYGNTDRDVDCAQTCAGSENSTFSTTATSSRYSRRNRVYIEIGIPDPEQNNGCDSVIGGLSSMAEFINENPIQT